MSLDLHRQAEELMGLGDALILQNDVSGAGRAFYEAAALEARAFGLIPSERPRTRGIIALSHVNLLVRAGALDEAIEAASLYVREQTLPRWAISEAAAIARGLAATVRPPFEERQPQVWRNPSVLRLAGDRDPIEAVTHAARATAYTAMEKGWAGPPYDPMELAGLMGIAVEPSSEVLDAEVALSGGSLLIRYNPNRPPARVRYSIAHDLAHTMFPDVAASVRARGPQPHPGAHDWELEMLCNLAAAELLMPVGSLAMSEVEPLNVDRLLELHAQYAVSIEAAALRAVQISNAPVAVFAASHDAATSRYSVDYVAKSRSWRGWTPHLGFTLPQNTVAAECTAVGWTAKGLESWNGRRLRVEAVGAPPYPDALLPRVIGLISPARKQEEGTPAEPRLHVVRGNALMPRGEGLKILAHVVNDRTPRWGAGFARQVRDRWPHVQRSFILWAERDPTRLALGSIHVADADDDLKVVSMVAQKGYGESKRARIRYQALMACLHQTAQVATRLEAPVHGPRMGTGFAGGKWSVVRGLLEEELVAGGVTVWIYDPVTDEELLTGNGGHAVNEGAAQLHLGIVDTGQ